MVRAGDVIENPVTGETMRFVLTGAETAVIRGTAPPWAVQQVLFAVIAPLGRLLGYRPGVPYPGFHERFAPPGPVAQDPFAHSRNL